MTEPDRHPEDILGPESYKTYQPVHVALRIVLFFGWLVVIFGVIWAVVAMADSGGPPSKDSVPLGLAILAIVGAPSDNNSKQSSSPAGDRSYTCPKCKSDQTQRVEVIFHAGTQTSRSRVFGTALAIGGNMRMTPAFGSAAMATTTTTSLASRVAPPQSPKLENPNAMSWQLKILAFVCAFGILIGSGQQTALSQFTFVALSSLGLVGVVAALARLVPKERRKVEGRNREREAKYVEDFTRWQNTWFCHRCGNDFLPSHSSPESS